MIAVRLTWILLAAGVALGDDRRDGGAAPTPGGQNSTAQATADATFASEEQTARQIASLRVWPRSGSSFDFPAHKTAPATVRSYPSWKRYEDEFISFAYPDDPAISVEVLDDTATMKVSGVVVSSKSYNWFRCYRLAHGEQTYFAIMLERTDELDDGFCFCGRVVFRACRFIHGALFRFSFLETGQIKSAEALCNGVHAGVFEWTHLPIHQDVYLRIALSLRLKNGPCDAKALRRMVYDTYGLYGRLSFVEPGMDKAALIAVMGEPDRDDEDALSYVEHEERDVRTYRLALVDGRFHGLDDKWYSVHRLPPRRGTVAWIDEVGAGAPSEDYELAPLTTEELKYIFDLFCEIAPGPEPHDWVTLCQAMWLTADKGHRDPRVAGIIRKHLLNPSLDHQMAIWYLRENDLERSRDAFVRLVEQKMEYAAKAEPEGLSLGGPVAEGGFDIRELLGHIGPEHDAYRGLVLAGMKHTHETIRSHAYDMWDDMPDEEVLPLLRKGLRDSSRFVRWDSARAFAERVGERLDLPLLRECLQGEQDESVREHLSLAIDRLEKLPDRK